MKEKTIKRPTDLTDYVGQPLKCQRVIWLICVEKAKVDKAWALDIKRSNRQWLIGASDMSFDSFIKCLTKSVEQMAIEKYRYWHHRTHAMSGDGFYIIDPAMRRDWLAAGGKMDKLFPVRTKW